MLCAKCKYDIDVIISVSEFMIYRAKEDTSFL